MSAVTIPEAKEIVSAVTIDGRRMLFSVPNQLVLWRIRTLMQKEPDTIAWLNRIPEGAVLYDVGANIGLYTIFAAVMRSAHVYAFEPEAMNYGLLTRNIVHNGLGERVLAYPAAVSDRTTLGKLFLSAQQAGSSCHSFGEPLDHRLERRETGASQGCLSLSLDDIVFAHGLPIPNFIKIDVDGLEELVLAGGQRVMASPSVRSVIVELNRDLTAHRNAIRLLEGAGFRYSPEQADGVQRTDGPFAGSAEIIFDRS